MDNVSLSDERESSLLTNASSIPAWVDTVERQDRASQHFRQKVPTAKTPISRGSLHSRLNPPPRQQSNYVCTFVKDVKNSRRESRPRFDKDSTADQGNYNFDE